MKITQGFAKENEMRVFHLHKSLYGLKQTSHNWYKKFTTFLLNIKFGKSKVDHSLFTQKDNGIYTTILIYVDDVIIARNNLDRISTYKEIA